MANNYGPKRGFQRLMDLRGKIGMERGRVSRLAELRQRTDQELLALIEREVDRALVLADLAAGEQSPMFQDARRTHEQARVLLGTIPAANQNTVTPEIARLLTKLKELRSATSSRSVAASRGQEPGAPYTEIDARSRHGRPASVTALPCCGAGR